LSDDAYLTQLPVPPKTSRLSSEHRRWSNASDFFARRLAIDRAQLGVADQAVDIVPYASNAL
jgi:hypothetical protein